MRAVGLGWDVARQGGDKTVYYCRQHGYMGSPCVCIDNYFKAQVRAARAKQIKENEDGGSKLLAAIRRGCRSR